MHSTNKAKKTVLFIARCSLPSGLFRRVRSRYAQLENDGQAGQNRVFGFFKFEQTHYAQGFFAGAATQLFHQLNALHRAVGVQREAHNALALNAVALGHQRVF